MQLWSPFLLFIMVQFFLSPVICANYDYGEEEDYTEHKEADMIYYLNKTNTRAGALNRFNVAESLIWPDNTVIYSFPFGTPTATRNRALSAMNDLSKALKKPNGENCLKFKQYNSFSDSGKHYTTINKATNPNTCTSTVGYDRRAGQSQSVNLGDNCDPASTVHEFIHTLGFFHEQTRNDRDDYLCVDINKVNCELQHNFVKDKDNGVPGYNTTYYGVPYNYESIMQYQLGAFAKNSSDPAMVHRCNRNSYGWQYDITYNQNYIYMSYGDLLMIARRYKCVEPKLGETYTVTDNYGRPLKNNNCKPNEPLRNCKSNSVSTCPN